MPAPDERPEPRRFSAIRSPLGVIGSFLTLVYGMALGALAFLTRGPDPQYLPLLWAIVLFLVVFPFFILGIFTWLVVRHTDKLYSPSEFGEHKPAWMKPAVPERMNRMPKKRRDPRPRKVKPKPASDKAEDPRT